MLIEIVCNIVCYAALAVAIALSIVLAMVVLYALYVGIGFVFVAVEWIADRIRRARWWRC